MLTGGPTDVSSTLWYSFIFEKNLFGVSSYRGVLQIEARSPGSSTATAAQLDRCLNTEMELSEPARLLLLASLLAKDGLISHNGEIT